MIFTVLLIVLLLAFPKPATFILLNYIHHPALDYFFRFMTFLGDGIFVVALSLLLLLFRQWRLAVLIMAGYALSGLCVQALKHYVNMPRPFLYFKHGGYTKFPLHVELHSIYSFPSGHTATAFALYGLLSFSIRKKEYSILFLIVAVLTAYSRIYLGQHFPEDVIAGAALGMLSAIICMKYLMPVLYKRKTADI